MIRNSATCMGHSPIWLDRQPNLSVECGSAYDTTAYKIQHMIQSQEVHSTQFKVYYRDTLIARLPNNQFEDVKERES